MASLRRADHSSVEVLRPQHPTLQTHASMLQADQHYSAKHSYWPVWKRSVPLQELWRHKETEASSTRDNCASAVVNATVLGITAAEQPATVLVKPPDLHVDIWDQIVAPAMSCAGLLVESWLHSTARLASTCCESRCTADAAGVQVGGRRWTVMQDHAKWGVCCDKTVVCFGDMNRVYSQRVRGGVAICMAAPSSSPTTSLPGQLYAHLLPALRKRRTTCFWKREHQCPCKQPRPSTADVLTRDVQNVLTLP